MDIDHPVALTVNQRGQFVHPAAVIGLIVGIVLNPFPARAEQRRFNVFEPVAGDEDVEIANLSTQRIGQAGSGIGGALEQDRH